MLELKGIAGGSYSSGIVGNLLLTPNCGIHQGSALSPTHFYLVMDPLLCNLRQRHLGLTVNGLLLGAFADADNICSNAYNNLLSTCYN